MISTGAYDTNAGFWALRRFLESLDFEFWVMENCGMKITI